MSHQKEHYIHFRSSSDILNKSRQILQNIKHHKDHSLVGPAFQFALIEYSKPYTNSYGSELNSKGKPKHKFSLSDEFIPERFKKLHKQIVTARNQILAHDDFTVKEATLHVSESYQGKLVGTVQNFVDGTEKLSQIDEIIMMIEETLDNIYPEIKRLEEALPATS